MDREYFHWYSPALQKNMELLVFGSKGTPVLFFPPRLGRFYDYENWNLIESLRPKIEKGYFQIFCVDSNDAESFYNSYAHPAQKISRHIQYEQYILNEVIPLIHYKNNSSFTIAAGCSLGAFHAVNIALKYPWLFVKVVGMSGRYDLTKSEGHYQDLFEGYWDENIYFNTPVQYIPNLADTNIIAQIKKIEIVLVIGQEDVLLQNNLLLSKLLTETGTKPTLHIWGNEAHKAKFWRHMVILYL